MTGPVLVFAGIGPALGPQLPAPRRHLDPGRGRADLGVVAVPIALALHSSVGVFLFVVQGLMLVGAAVVLVSQQQGAIGHAVGRLAKRSFRVRLGLAYPLARRFRTSMTLGMFALVVFILVIRVGDRVDVRRAAGPVHARCVGWVQRVDRRRTRATRAVRRGSRAQSGVRAVAPLVASLDLEVVRAPGLTRATCVVGHCVRPRVRAARCADARRSRLVTPPTAAAYAAVLADPNLAIVDKFFLSSGNGPPAQQIAIGDQFTVRDAGQWRAAHTFTVAALGTNDWANNGVLMSQTAARETFGGSAVPSRAYVDVSESRSVRVVVRGPLPRERRQRGDDSQHGARPALATSNSSSC